MDGRARARSVAGALLTAALLVGACAAPERPATKASEPEPLAAAAVAYVADGAVSRNSTSQWITVPSAVLPGDRLVLFVSLNAANRQISAPGGWSAEGDRTSRTMRTLVWSKVASQGDAGSRVSVTLDRSAKGTVQVVAYRGVGTGPLVVASAIGTTTATSRRTPTVSAPDGAWVASYWAAKSASASSWTPPASVVPRRSAANGGSGRILSLLADSGEPVSGGVQGGLTATSDAATSAATTWTVALPPAGGSGGVRSVPAERETEPVAHSGDAADDPAIWVDRATPADSLVIGNDKQGALEVYDLDGTRVQRITTATSFWGNVDVRQGVTVGGRTLDVVLAYNSGVRTFAVDPVSRRLTPVGDGDGAISTGGGEGLCAYHSTAGDLYVFVVSRAGRVRQYRINDADGDGLLQGTLVREFAVGSESEGCVADDASGRLYVSEEQVGLWRYGAEPDAGSQRVQVDAVRPEGHLAYDVEGVTIAATGPSAGYVIVSAQNGASPQESYFAVYDRQTNDYLWSFDIAGGTDADGCERTDGVTAYSGDLGPDFRAGLFVCQDNGNTAPGQGNQDFKYTGLDAILP